MNAKPETTGDADGIIAYAKRAERIEHAMRKLTAPVPSTKGMGPADRAQRLHAEMERRIAIAQEALRHIAGELAYE